MVYFIMENPSKMEDLEVPPILGNLHMAPDGYMFVVCILRMALVTGTS
jgi:hypothetical protein